MLRKKLSALIALVMAVAVLAGVMAGCDATVSDPVVAKIGDIDVPYSRYYTMYQNLYRWYTYGYFTFDEGQDADAEMRQKTFDYILDQYVPIAKAHADGLTLDDDEMVTAKANADSELQSYLSQYSSYVDSSITDETEIYNAELVFLKQALQNSGIDYDDFISSLEEQEVNKLLGDKMVQSVRDAVEVTDEDIQNWYDTTLATQHEYFDADPASYYTYYTQYLSYGGVEPLFAPEGYYYVKHILIKNAADGEDKDVDAIVAEIEDKIAAGEDFDALVAEYNEDTGMYADGYPFHESIADKYNTEFSDAALKLEKEGDISEPVTSSSGVHILKRYGDIPSAEKTVAELHDEIYDYLFAEYGDTAETDAIAQWADELHVKTYPKRVRYIEYDDSNS